VRILVWHVHGGWMDSFVQGAHDYLLPTTADGGPWGLGRGGRDWPAGVVERSPEELAHDDIDVVVLQRPEELAECERITGRRPGRDLPAVYLEHNTPKGNVPFVLHPLADQSEIPIVHVTHFNRVFWDNGRAPVRVIEHGIVDPGARYTGERASQGVVVNEPVRRGRVTGTDLLPAFAEAGPLEVFGIDTEQLPGAIRIDPARMLIRGNVSPGRLREQLPGCRLYVHPLRWTSLGLALLEAMQLAMPVVVLDVTEASRAVPPDAGAISADVGELVRTARRLIADPDEARTRGRVAREAALARYGLARFLADWEQALDDAVAKRPRSRADEGSAA
jgi:hypothetical protein